MAELNKYIISDSQTKSLEERIEIINYRMGKVLSVPRMKL